jgi:DNA mismatch repair protein MutH
MARARSIAGLSLGELAQRLEVVVPEDPRRSKGFAGQLLELALGASAGSLAEPDFQLIGVELKSLPFDHRGQPAESTYVCTVDLEHRHLPRWQDALVRRKLARVLWLPVEASATAPLRERRIGMGALWSPDAAEERRLRQDWEELTELVCLGQVESITAHHGQWLQIRPKAANARARRFGTDHRGQRSLTLPRGFYLRTTFTRRILQQHFASP